jgi:uncharacterized membrane protein YbhN (UPF0104 family)
MEVLKWKYSIRPITEITLSKAFVGVLSGITLGFVTPHAIGDYFAKVYSLNHPDRKKALGLILIARMMQMLPTASFGLLAFFIFSRKSFAQLDIPVFIPYPILSILGLVLLVMLLIFFLKRNHSKIKDFIVPIKKMGLELISILAGLSILRYLIFSIQFLLLLSILNLNISIFMQFMGVSFMFLAKSIIPTFNFLSDLGIREFSAVLFFESIDIEAAPIIAAGLLLWLINIALPALLGLFFIPQLKLNRA